MATGIWTSPFFEVRPSGASPLPQGVGVYTLFLVSTGQMWGGKPPPTGDWGVHTIFGEHRANVGGGLPPMASVRLPLHSLIPISHKHRTLRDMARQAFPV